MLAELVGLLGMGEPQRRHPAPRAAAARESGLDRHGPRDRHPALPVAGGQPPASRRTATIAPASIIRPSTGGRSTTSSSSWRRRWRSPTSTCRSSDGSPSSPRTRTCPTGFPSCRVAEEFYPPARGQGSVGDDPGSGAPPRVWIWLGLAAPRAAPAQSAADRAGAPAASRHPRRPAGRTAPSSAASTLSARTTEPLAQLRLALVGIRLAELGAEPTPRRPSSRRGG